MITALYAIYGASGFGREIMPVARQQLARRLAVESYELVFIDDRAEDPVINGHRVMPFDEFLAERCGSKHVSLAIADCVLRQGLAERCLAGGANFFEVRAESATVLDDCVIGEGAVLCPYVTLTSNIVIGRHFHANLYSYVAHDCVVGDFVTFAPNVHCNGNVVVEDQAYIGTGAVLRQGKPGAPLVIGRGAVVGMGAVVTRSVPPLTTVVGNPARALEK